MCVYIVLRDLSPPPSLSGDAQGDLACSSPRCSWVSASHRGAAAMSVAAAPHSMRSRPGCCSSVAVPPCGALEGARVRWSLSSGPNRAPRLRTRAAAPSIPDDPGPVGAPDRQTGRRVTEVLDLLAMWALLQVFFVWCLARWAELKTLDSEEYRYEGEIQPVTRPQGERTAGSHIRSNPTAQRSITTTWRTSTFGGPASTATGVNERISLGQPLVRRLKLAAPSLLASVPAAAVPACRAELRVDLCKRPSGDGSQQVTVNMSLPSPSDESEQCGIQAPRRTATEPCSSGGARARDPSEGPEMPLGYRFCRVLAVIAAHAGASSREVAEAAGISDEGQISRILTRLRSLGLIRDSGQWCMGQPHSWRLTAQGRRAVPASAAELQLPGGRG